MSSLNDREIQRFSKEIKRKFKELKGEYRVKARKELLRKSGRPMLEAVRAYAPKGRRSKRAVVTLKDGGKVAYYPGNLKISIRYLPLRKTADVFIGPKVYAKRRDGDVFGLSKAKAEAHYAHMIERGTRLQKAQPFMRPGFDSTKAIVLKNMETNFLKVFNKWKKKSQVR